MTDHTPAKRKLRIGCWGFVILTLASFSGYVWYQHEKGWTERKVALALKDAPPPSSTRTEIEGWLKKIRWTTYNYFQDVTCDMLGHQTMPQLAGLSHSALSGMLRVDVPNPNVDLICPGTIQVYFFFDHEGRLVDHLLVPFVWSL